MQELLGRIASLDPSASLGLRVIACFDELVIGNVNTKALLAAAASLAGCPAGFHQDHPVRTMRVGPRGDLLAPAAESPQTPKTTVTPQTAQTPQTPQTPETVNSLATPGARGFGAAQLRPRLSGARPPGAEQAGAQLSGNQQAGTQQAGTQRSGTQRSVTQPSGAAKAGAWPTSAGGDGLRVWLERTGPAQPNDAIILERLALAIRLRHGRSRGPADHRRDLGLLLDGTLSAVERDGAAAALGLTPTRLYRVVAAPLFAVWEEHPRGIEDVVPTAYGPIHALVISDPGELSETVRGAPAGVGVAAGPAELHHSFRTALVALKLCDPPRIPVTVADEFGGLLGLLADAPEQRPNPDADRLGELAEHGWGPATIEAVIRSASVRQAARLAGVHHSTMQTRLDTMSRVLAFDPFDGFGKPRLGTAYLVWRLRNSRVLDLPAPSQGGTRVAAPGRGA